MHQHLRDSYFDFRQKVMVAVEQFLFQQSKFFKEWGSVDRRRHLVFIPVIDDFLAAKTSRKGILPSIRQIERAGTPWVRHTSRRFW